MKKIHLISLVTAITVIWAVVEIPTAIKNNYDLITHATGLQQLSFTSALITCTYYVSGIEVYQDGTSISIGSDTLAYAPTLNLINPTTLKTVDHYTLYPQVTCYGKSSSTSAIISSNTISGSFQIYAKVMGTDGNYHLILNQAYSIPTTTVVLGKPFVFGSYNIPASGIAQYNTVSGTTSSVIDFSNEPILTIYTNFIDSSYGTPQKSIWSNWADIRWTATVQNTPATNTKTVVSSQTPTQKSGTQITTADVKFAYALGYYGSNVNTCGTVVGQTPAGLTCTASASGTSNIPLNALDFIPSSTISTNSLNSLSAQLLVYPKGSGYVLDTQNVGYTGTILYQDSTNQKTINIPASSISIVQQTSQQGSIFAFGTAVIDPAKLDNLLQTNGIKTTTPFPVTISIYATGNFQGHTSIGNFKGIVDGASLTLKTYYVSSATVGNSCTLTSDPCNKNVCHDLSGNGTTCYIPPASGDGSQQTLFCTLYPLDPNCAKANPPQQPTPTCNSSDPTVPCIGQAPADPQNPPINIPCYGSCTTPTTNNQQPTSNSQTNPPAGTTIPVGQFFNSGLPTASATPSGAVLCPNSTSASDCANYLYSLVSVPTLNQNLLVVIGVALGVIAIIGIILYKRKNK